MAKTAEELLAMERQVEKAEKEATRIGGQLDGQYARLKKEYGLETLEAVDTELARLDGELAAIEADLTSKVEDLKKAYPWEGVAK